MGWRDALDMRNALKEAWVSGPGQRLVQRADSDEMSHATVRSPLQDAIDELLGVRSTLHSSLVELLDKTIRNTGTHILPAEVDIANGYSLLGNNFEYSYAKVLYEISLASPVWVSAPICDLIEQGERSWPEKFTLRREDVPVESGFVVFERPLWLPDLFDHSMKFPEKSNLVAISWYADAGMKIADIDNPGIHEPNALTYTFWTETYGLGRGNLGPGLPDLAHSSGWMYGEHESWMYKLENQMTEGARRTHEQHLPRSSKSVRYLATLLRFITTRVVDSEVAPVQRKVRRRYESKGTWAEVRVISLRRREVIRTTPEEETTSEDSSEKREVNWRGRWKVDAHWHNYRLKDGSYRTRWVDEYEKGPEGLPFIKEVKAYEVKR